jgi:hypothetical protein
LQHILSNVIFKEKFRRMVYSKVCTNTDKKCTLRKTSTSRIDIFCHILECTSMCYHNTLYILVKQRISGRVFVFSPQPQV